MTNFGSHPETARRLARVLLVDDEPLVLRAMRRLILSRHPAWHVLCASSTDDALRLLAAFESMDVMVTDLNMPNVDGIVLLNIVRERYPRVVRVVHSAHIEAFGRSCVQELCFHALAKPARATELVGTLEMATGILPNSLVAG